MKYIEFIDNDIIDALTQAGFVVGDSEIYAESYFLAGISGSLCWMESGAEAVAEATKELQKHRDKKRNLSHSERRKILEAV